MGIELNQIRGGNVTLSEFNTLAGITATTADLNKLTGLTVTTVELNQITSLIANLAAHTSSDLLTAHPIASVNGDALIQVNSLSLDRIIETVTVPADLVPITTDITTLQALQVTDRADIDNILAIIAPGISGDVSDAIAAMNDHLADPEDAHNADSISFIGFRFLAADTAAADTFVLLSSLDDLLTFKVGDSVEIDDNVLAASPALTITGIDIPNLRLDLSGPVGGIYQTSGSALVRNLTVDDVQTALERVEGGQVTTVIASAQDRSIILIEGGDWSVNAAGDTLSWTADAYLRVSGLTDTRNTIPLVSSPIVLPAVGDAAYVDINRDPGAADNLTINVAPIQSIVFDEDRFIIAHRVTEGILAGNDAVLIQPGVTTKLNLGGDPIASHQDRNSKLIEGGEWLHSGGGAGGAHSETQAADEFTGLGYAVTSTTRLDAYEFTPSVNFTATSIEIDWNLAGARDGIFVIEVVPVTAGDPDETTILGTTAAIDASTLGASPVVHNFVAPIALTGGTKYAYIVRFTTIGTLGSLGYLSTLASPVPGHGHRVSTDGGVTWPTNDTTVTASYVISGTTATPSTITFDEDAFIQLPDFTNDRNRIEQATQSPITLTNVGDVAYVDINRRNDVATDLVVTVAAIEDVAFDPDRLIIARRVSDGVLVGNGTIKLRSGERGKLERPYDNSTVTIGPAGSFADYQTTGTNDNLVFDLAVQDPRLSDGGEILIYTGTYNFSSDHNFAQGTISYRGVSRGSVDINLPPASIPASGGNSCRLSFMSLAATGGGTVDFNNTNNNLLEFVDFRNTTTTVTFNNQVTTARGCRFINCVNNTSVRMRVFSGVTNNNFTCNADTSLNQHRLFGGQTIIGAAGSLQANECFINEFHVGATVVNQVSLLGCDIAAFSQNATDTSTDTRIVDCNIIPLVVPAYITGNFKGNIPSSVDTDTGSGDTFDAKARFQNFLDNPCTEFGIGALNHFAEKDAELALVDEPNSTGELSLLDKTFDLDTGEIMQSSNLIDTGALGADTDVYKVAINTFYRLPEIGVTDIHRISRMGGATGTFQTVEMNREANGDVLTGIHEFEEEIIEANLITQPLGSLFQNLTDGTLPRLAMAQPFTLVLEDDVKHVDLYMTRFGSPAGSFSVIIVGELSPGVPDLTNIYGNRGFNPVSTIGTSETLIRTDVGQKLDAGTYYAVVQTNLAYKSSFAVGVDEIRISEDVDAGIPDLLEFDGLTWSVAIATESAKHDVVVEDLILQQIDIDNPVANQDGSIELTDASGAVLPGPSIASQVSGGGVVTASGNTMIWPGQQINPTSSGNLAEVDFYMSRIGAGSSGNIVVEIYSDNGSNEPNVLLGTSDPINANTLAAFPTHTLTTFSFSTPVAVTSGTLYHAVCNTSAVTYGGDTIAWDTGPGIDDYPAGNFVRTTDSGTSWTTSTTPDMRFDVRLEGVSSSVQEFTQPFTLTNGVQTFKKVKFRIDKLGAATGNLFIAFHKDNGSTEPGEELFEQSVSIDDLAIGTNSIEVLTSDVTLSDQVAHMRIRTDIAYKTGFTTAVDSISVGLDTTAPAGTFDARTYNGTSWADLTGSRAVMELEGRIVELVLQVESTAVLSKLAAFAVAYGVKEGVVDSQPLPMVFTTIAPTAAEVRVPLPTLVPLSPLRLEAKVQGGLVLTARNGDFTIEGDEAVFAPGVFDIPEAVKVTFTQFGDVSVADVSKMILDIFSEQHLGSELDNGADFSSAGRGIKLRATDNTLVELRLIETGGIYAIDLEPLE